MKLYFLLEGKRTEVKVYPAWLSFLLPDFEELPSPDETTENGFYTFSGQGYPQILNHIKNSVKDIQDYNYDYFIIVVDADDDTVQERTDEIENYVSKQDLTPCKVKIIVQNRCIETWFLGNKKIFTGNPQQSDFLKYIQFYNVKQNDPEKMLAPESFTGSIAHFHGHYLKKMLKEKYPKLHYTKRNPGTIKEEHYLHQLIQRSEEQHIQSFKTLIDLCKEIKLQSK